MMKSNRKWSITFLSVVFFLIVGLGAVTVVIDPYFHYHAPLDSLEYLIDDERYQNDGIMKHFKYDAILTGTSMTENFKTSEFDRLFHVNSIKVPFSGASYKEVNENLERAVEANPDIQLIIRGIDYNALEDSKDSIRYPTEFYPVYLYDNKLYNDVKYILNKSILFNSTLYVLEYTNAGNKTTNFDSYMNWNSRFDFGKDAVNSAYRRSEKADITAEMTNEDYQKLQEHLQQNIIQLVKQNPQIDFYLFFTPYSIYYWDSLNQSGMLKRQLKLEKEAIEALLPYDNLYLFSFFDEFNMICDLNNYRDIVHYGEHINSQILSWMRNKEHLLTEKNYQEYCDKVYKFYTTDDYDALFYMDSKITKN